MLVTDYDLPVQVAFDVDASIFLLLLLLIPRSRLLFRKKLNSCAAVFSIALELFLRFLFAKTKTPQRTVCERRSKNKLDLLLTRSMALESYLTLKCANSKVTVIGSNPVRRELVLGFEDGSVQTFDYESG